MYNKGIGTTENAESIIEERKNTQHTKRKKKNKLY